ncbi:MAG: hypothetical protein EPN93_14780 [Spirochaetes bacterium]|nr:MAG: hypothetical protein EPN93_14780 [Spirochaetota bacterium]
MPEEKKANDMDLDFFDIDVDLDNPFAGDIKKDSKSPVIPEKEPEITLPSLDEVPGFEEVEHTPQRRSSKDFNPDMDALLMTAQSPMILEGMKYYTQGNFSSQTMPVYLEALKGIALYIKILDRNPANFNKLQKLIDADSDCKEVETIAFNLFKMIHGRHPENDQEKLVSFERFEQLFKEAASKASISNSMKLLKKYLLMSGSIDELKVRDLFKRGNTDLKADINNLAQHLQLGLDLMKKGRHEIAKGLKGRDLNIYVIKASYLLYLFYSLAGNENLADHYARLHNNYKKYFIIRE